MNKQAIGLLVGGSILFIISSTLFAAGGDMGGAGRDGSADYPYLIEDFDDFQVFCSDPNYWASGVCTELDCDLDLDPNLVGRQVYTTAVIGLFKGIFDGDNHTISNVIIDTAGVGKDDLGLFSGIEDPNAEVKNLNLEKVSITGGDESSGFGVLCGFNSGTITNCYTNGLVTGKDFISSLGGLCGGNSGVIINCHSNSSIGHGYYSFYFGGLCGSNTGTITNCYATGKVNGHDSVGGLCGWNNGSISNCYATGEVSGISYIGGLCGSNGDKDISGGTITNCYATGLVSGKYDLWFSGGFCGENYGTISNCYFYIFNGPDNSIGTDLDELQMLDANNFVGFDFAGDSNDGDADYWTMVNGHCPKLFWQSDEGSLVPDPPVTTLSGGGHSNDPFQINSFTDFMEFVTNSALCNGYYILTTDIDLNEETFTTAVVNRYFGGHLDGNNHFIRNLTIDATGEYAERLGLFSTISGSISNLNIENINIISGECSYHLGGLCGANYGIITNCNVAGSVTSTDWSRNLGGLCGINRNGTIVNCYFTGVVTGGYSSEQLGGLCGYNSGTITNCHVTSEVTGGYCSWQVGGLCGNNGGGTITNCYAISDVTAGNISSELGGLCGSNELFNDYTGELGSINNCYSCGVVTSEEGSSYIGGLCGVNGSTITNCYSTTEVTGDNLEYLGGLCGYNNSSITKCYAAGDVISMIDSNYLGGLCGYNGGDINDCYATGAVIGYESCLYLGGLCGRNDAGEITNCYATGVVEGILYSGYLGGLCGRNISGSTISNCYSIGQVVGFGTYYGGLCGRNTATISNCFWDTQTSGDKYSSGGTGKTTAQMQTGSTFTDAPASWDFADTWWINDGRDYPKLAWQPFGDLDGDNWVNMYDFAVMLMSWQAIEGDVSFNSVCELSGDNVIDEADLSELAGMSLEGPGFSGE